MVEHERTGLLDLITWSISRVAMWLPAFIVSIIFYEVVMRYVFERPTLWVNEMSLWVAGAIYLTAGLYALQQRSHIRIFIIYDMVPRWMQRFFDTLSVTFAPNVCNCALTSFLGLPKVPVSTKVLSSRGWSTFSLGAVSGQWIPASRSLATTSRLCG